MSLLYSDPYKCRNFGNETRKLDLDCNRLYTRESELLRHIAVHPEYPMVPGRLFKYMFNKNMLDWVWRTPTPKEVRAEKRRALHELKSE